MGPDGANLFSPFLLTPILWDNHQSQPQPFGLFPKTASYLERPLPLLMSALRGLGSYNREFKHVGSSLLPSELHVKFRNDQLLGGYPAKRHDGRTEIQ